jgi:hypothetical protein
MYEYLEEKHEFEEMKEKLATNELGKAIFSASVIYYMYVCTHKKYILLLAAACLNCINSNIMNLITFVALQYVSPLLCIGSM